MSNILLIPNIKIHNANALSSPYTIGFPAMSAWLGFMRALERKLQDSEFNDIKFSGIIVSCLDINLHTHREGFISSIIATSNPLDESGKRPSFIAEARCDLEVSIAIECQIQRLIDTTELANIINQLLHTMKIASGDIISINNSRILEVENHNPITLTKYLMPGFCLVSRQDLMKTSMESGQDAIYAALDYLKLSTKIEITDDHKIKRDKPNRKTSGWLVPIAIGFQGISELSQLKNSRDTTTPHKFAESIVTLGEFKMPHHFDSIDEMMWRYKADMDNNLYLCQNAFKPTEEQESKL